MARTSKTSSLIEFKGTTLPVVSVTLHSLQPGALAGAATDLFGEEAFFDRDAAILELDRIDAGEVSEAVDWASLCSTFSQHGLRVIGVRGGSDALHESAANAGLPSFTAFKRSSRRTEKSAPAAAVQDEPVQEAAVVAEAVSEALVVQPASSPTLVIDRPLRSGQQIYARGGDLVVLAAVNAGA